MGNLTHFLYSIAFVVIGTLINFGLEPFMGYWGLGLIYLLVVIIQTYFTNRGAIIFSAIMAAACWNFLFIPPRFTFHITRPEDLLLLLVFLIVAIVGGNISVSIARNKKIIESERLYKLIFNSLSHELRTPITTIQGALSNLQNQNIINDVTLREEIISEIESANQRLNRLINNLLDMSRLEAGHLKATKEWCDISDLISTSLRHWRHGKENFPEVQINFEADLPLLLVDFVLLEQALINLIQNAFTHGEKTQKIQIDVRKVENFIEISITDFGKGISPKALPHIFEKFYRDPHSRPGGIGLGLAIAKGVIELHGGSIFAFNKQNAGACVTMQIPISEVPSLPNEGLQ